MVDKNTDFFKIEDHFKETEHIPSIPIFENHLCNTPKFTIAIPTYKRAKYLKEAIESAINQDTNEPYEIIVVDNNPERDDDTEKLMCEYSSLPNVSYYKNSENIGMTGNWNRLYTLCRTEWTVMLHDDDLLFKNFISMISESGKLMDRYEVIFPSFTSQKIYSSRKDISYFTLNKWDLLRCNTVIGPPIGMTMRTSSMIKAGGFDASWYPASDYELYCRLITRKPIACKIYGSPICWYRIEENESVKEDTLYGFYQAEVKIHKIMTCNLFPPIKKFWDLYKTRALLTFAKACLNTFNPNANKIIILEKKLECEQSILTKCIYWGYNHYWRLRRRLFRKRRLRD